MEKSDSHHRRRRHHHRRRRAINFDEIPGVERIRLSPMLQQLLKAVVGEHVTTEKPWVYVEKEEIQDNLEVHEESSEFLAYKEKIMAFTREKMLLLYIPDEEREYDEFYICLTEQATDTVDEIIKKQQENQQRRLYNAINKGIRKWSTLGSEEEIDEITPKRSRPLLEVEVESRYPILPFDVRFKFRKVEEARDGYMDFMPSDESQRIIQKKRVDAMVQISPPTINNDCQTNYPFPRNDYTQYEYLIKVEPELFSRYIADLKRFSEENQDDLFDQLMVNWNINLYSDDYLKLCSETEVGVKRFFLVPPLEYISFIDVNLCKDKMISSVCWHPLLSGIVAIAYVDMAPNLRRKSKSTVDEVNRTIHERHLSLLWSFNDKLSPKLILESHREVTCISFCPFDENLLIGGCSNGQIIIWDIRGKIERVETEEIMTSAQERYRAYMFSLMEWMKNIHNIAVVRPTAISDLRHSHTDAIIQISWCNPLCEITKTGKMQEADGNYSCQFFTASEDGSVAIWDLLKKPVIHAGGFKPQRRLKRLKQRPPALMAETSPLKIFHLSMKPIYRVWIPQFPEASTVASIGALACEDIDFEYELLNFDPKKKIKFTDRLRYSATPLPQICSSFTDFSIGTLTGDFITAKFDGLDFDSGEIVNSEYAEVHSRVKFHDGPIQSISKYGEIILTCGGKLFAIWLKDFPERPVLWRKQNVNYTFACFNTHYKSRFRATREDGYIEMWGVSIKSKTYEVIAPTSSKPLTGTYSQPRKLNACFGNADTFGSLRLYRFPSYYKEHCEGDDGKLLYFLRREASRKKKFLAWQDRWNKNNTGLIEMKKVKEDTVRATEEEVKDEKEEKVAKKSSKAGLTYIEYEKLDRERRQRESINRMITEKKRLDIPELNRQRRPLQILEEEREKKKRKQRRRLRNAENIFQETVEMLFPEVAKQKEEPPPDPYAGGYSEEEKSACSSRYEECREKAEQIMEEKPFTYVFDWKNVLLTARERRSKMEKSINSHRKRHTELRVNRMSVSVDNDIVLSTREPDGEMSPEKQLSAIDF